MVAVGGGTRAALWPQIVSDVTGLAQCLPRESIGASYGDALLAAIGAGLVVPETDWSQTEAIVEARAESAQVYDELFDLHGRLYSSTVDVAHRLAAMSAS